MKRVVAAAGLAALVGASVLLSSGVALAQEQSPHPPVGSSEGSGLYAVGASDPDYDSIEDEYSDID